MRKMLVFLGLILCLTQSLLFSQTMNYKPFQADKIIKDNLGQVSKARVFVKGDKSRIENPKMITILNGQKAYAYYPEKNLAMSLPIDQLLKQAPELSAKFSTRCTQVGQETIDGRLCDVQECESAEYGVRTKIWTAPDLGGYPIKDEAVYSGTVVGSYLKNITTGVNLSDSLFELPAGVQVMDMENMMQNMSGMIDEMTGAMKNMKESGADPQGATQNMKNMEQMSNSENMKALMKQMKEMQEKLGDMPD